MIKLKTLLGEVGKFYKGSPHNDEPFDFRDDTASSSTKTNPEFLQDVTQLIANFEEINDIVSTSIN
jgi:hypothetical protein